MYHLPLLKRIKVKNCLREGKSIRQTMRETGAACGTVQKYRNKLADAGEIPQLCSCGRANGHRGWCEERLSKSPARRKFLKKFVKMGIEYRIRSNPSEYTKRL